MTNTLLLLVLSALPMDTPWPKSTQEMENQVKLLGSDSWPERVKAQEKVEKYGWKALGAIREGMKSKDAEIARRCKIIWDKYNIIDTDGCLLFQINEVNLQFLKFTVELNDMQIPTYNPKIKINLASKEELEKRIKIYKTSFKRAIKSQRLMAFADNAIFYNQKISEEALKDYAKDLLKRGVKKHNLEKCLKFIKHMPDGPPEVLGYGAIPMRLRK